MTSSTSEIVISVAWDTDGGSADELHLAIPVGTTLAELIASARLPQLLADLIEQQAMTRVGVWGRIRAPGYVLRADDRVELYRALRVDPKQQRVLRNTKNPGAKIKP